MTKSLVMILAVGSLMLSGCASMYAGADVGLASVGAVKRGDNLYDVVYMGQDKKPHDFRRDMALKQSAELCKAQGFKYFKASDTQTFSTFITPDKLPAGEAPQVTLQVSCFAAQDNEAIQPVDTVIARIAAQYVIN